MAAPAAVMVENSLDFMCLLGGDVSATEHLGTPVSLLSLPGPPCSLLGQHSQLGGAQSPCTAPD